MNSPGKQNALASKLSDELARPKELARDMIRMLKTHKNNTKLTGALQVIAIRDDWSFISLSDGFSYSEVAVFKDARGKLEKEQEVKKLDVIMATMLFFKEMIVLVEATKVYTCVREMIGRPIDYTSYIGTNYNNGLGDSAIPKYLCEPKRAVPVSPMTFEECPRIPISNVSLNPGMKFSIMARATKKTYKKEFYPKNGASTKGVLFSCTFVDNSGEIQMTFFEEFVTKYFDYIEDNKTYMVACADVKRKGRYNTTSHQLEFHMGPRTNIMMIPDDGSIQAAPFNFVKLQDVMARPVRSSCDVVGLVQEVTPITEVHVKGKEMITKQTVFLLDDSECMIEISLWDRIPGQLDLKSGEIAIIIECSISDYRGRLLNSKGSTRVITKLPDHPRVAAVKDWYAKNPQKASMRASTSANTYLPPNNASLNSTSILDFAQRPSTALTSSVLITISHFKKLTDEALRSNSEKKGFYTVRGFLTGFSATFYYDKCPNSSCFKKVVAPANRPGTSDCPTCGPLQGVPVAKYIGHIRVTDHTGSMFIHYANDSAGCSIYDKPCEELKYMLLNAPEDYHKYSRDRLGSMMTFRVFAKREYFQGEIKNKYNLVSAMEEVTNARIKSSNQTLHQTLSRLVGQMNSEALKEAKSVSTDDQQQAQPELVSN